MRHRNELPDAIGDTSGPQTVATAGGRIAGLDALRGLMLTIVLADHCSGSLAHGGFIRQWTLMGLGWSDAADAFVFLSGFTFGWVYSARVEVCGAWKALRTGLLRSLHLYLAYLLIVMGVTLINALKHEKMWPAIAAGLEGELLITLLLRHHPPSTAILCLYVVCLPYTLLLFVTFRRKQSWLYFLISYGVYSLAQLFPSFNLPANYGGWFFNPFAWQLLMSSGALFGRELRAGNACVPRAGALCVAACTVVALAFFSRRAA